MSSTEPSSEVPIACISKRTASCWSRRRWISAITSPPLAPSRPTVITVISAVAIAAALQAPVNGVPCTRAQGLRSWLLPPRRVGAAARPRRQGRGVHLRPAGPVAARSEEHTSELQLRQYLVCRLLLEKKNILTSSSQLYLAPPGVSHTSNPPRIPCHRLSCIGRLPSNSSSFCSGTTSRTAAGAYRSAH